MAIIVKILQSLEIFSNNPDPDLSPICTYMYSIAGALQHNAKFVGKVSFLAQANPWQNSLNNYTMVVVNYRPVSCILGTYMLIK